MKKLLILAGVVALTMSTQAFASDTSTVTTKEAQPVQQEQQRPSNCQCPKHAQKAMSKWNLLCKK